MCLPGFHSGCLSGWQKKGLKNCPLIPFHLEDSAGVGLGPLEHLSVKRRVVLSLAGCMSAGASDSGSPGATPACTARHT